MVWILRFPSVEDAVERRHLAVPQLSDHLRFVLFDQVERVLDAQHAAVRQVNIEHVGRGDASLGLAYGTFLRAQEAQTVWLDQVLLTERLLVEVVDFEVHFDRLFVEQQVGKYRPLRST